MAMHNVNYKRKIRICHQQKCVENLRHIIEATDAKVVATSDWKYIMSFMELLDTWKARNLPGELIGTTPNCSLHRGDEIDEWLFGCDEEALDYIILDDMDASCFNEHQLSRLLIVNPYTGLDEETAERAIVLLNR